MNIIFKIDEIFTWGSVLWKFLQLILLQIFWDVISQPSQEISLFMISVVLSEGTWLYKGIGIRSG